MKEGRLVTMTESNIYITFKIKESQLEYTTNFVLKPKKSSKLELETQTNIELEFVETARSKVIRTKTMFNKQVEI